MLAEVPGRSAGVSQPVAGRLGGHRRGPPTRLPGYQRLVPGGPVAPGLRGGDADPVERRRDPLGDLARCERAVKGGRGRGPHFCGNTVASPIGEVPQVSSEDACATSGHLDVMVLGTHASFHAAQRFPMAQRCIRCGIMSVWASSRTARVAWWPTSRAVRAAMSRVDSPVSVSVSVSVPAAVRNPSARFSRARTAASGIPRWTVALLARACSPSAEMSKPLPAPLPANRLWPRLSSSTARAAAGSGNVIEGRPRSASLSASASSRSAVIARFSRSANSPWV